MIVPDRVVTGLCPVQAERSSATAKRHPRSHAVAAIIVGVLTMVSRANAQSAPWHYDLRTGDHLTYRYTFHRQIDIRKHPRRLPAQSGGRRSNGMHVQGQRQTGPRTTRLSETHALASTEF